MKYLLTIDGIGDRILVADGGATVGDVVESVGGPPRAGLVVERTRAALEPGEPLDTSDLRSGDRVRLRAPTETETEAEAGAGTRGPVSRPAAIVRIVAGPSAPAAVELGFGDFTVGRGVDCDVVILDEAMSRRHASIVVDDDSVEIVDLGARNGVVVGDVKVSGPTSLTPDSMVLLGGTWLQVEHLNRARGLGDVGGASVPFNRPPRVVKPYEARVTKVPKHPGRQPKPRLPKISALAPLLLGVGMIYLPLLFGGRPNYYFGMFMLFSPVMLMGSYLENRSATRREYREAMALHRTEMEELEDRLERLQIAEQEGRRAAAPAPDRLQPIVDSLSPRLWERALDDPDALSVRIGLADLRSENRIEVPDAVPRPQREIVDGLIERYGVVRDVPLLVDIGRNRGVGISGPQQFSHPLSYAVIAQLATLHSPAELLLAAMVPDHARVGWEWLKWLPHCPAEDSVIGGHPLAADEAACRSLLHRLLAVVESRLEAGPGFDRDQALPAPAIVVLVAEGLAAEQSDLTRLLESGPRAGVFTIWVSAASRRVPRSLGAVVQIGAGGQRASVGLTATGQTVDDIAVELLDRRHVECLARSLSPIDDVSATFSTASLVPTRVNLVDLLGGPSIMTGTDQVRRYWDRHPKTLAAPVGRLADREFTLDLRRDGPHALVGGTTGAGKSEFLQSWVASLAVTHSPRTVTFLLVDYKGGAAFKDCGALPHTVGMVTDLDNAGVRRALVSLRAELHHRERLLARHDCADLLEMIDKAIPETPPSLLIIVDEFAALVQEVPEFIDGMVDVAQRGRSLGLHLVLATQRPAGVITPQVKANTDLRIALRMADTEDSVDVIDTPDAADIDRAVPGRAIARIGRDRFPFQSAYVGGVTSDIDPGPAVEVATFDFGCSTPQPGPAVPVIADRPATTPTDLERLVANLRCVHADSGFPPPRKPWLEPLRPVYDLAEFDHPVDDGLVLLGLADRPEHQSQVPLYFEPDVDGSMGIVGTGGSGKTVALRTLAASVAMHGMVSDDPAFVYGIDFGGRGLRILECLPQVGTIAYEDETELIRRMLADLETMLDRRVDQLSAVRAASIGEFRSARPDEPMSRIHLIIDNYPSFHELFEPLENERYVRLVRRLILEGRQVGMHVVITSPRREAVSFTIQRAIGRWMVLRQTSVDDYRALEVPSDLLTEKSPAGRAIHDRHEAQVALLGTGTSAFEQAEALQALAHSCAGRGMRPAPAVRLLPELVRCGELGNRSAIGLRDRDFAEHRLPDGFRVFLVSGPRASGRSTVLASIARSVSDRFDRTILLAMKRPVVAVDPLWSAAVGQDEIEQVIDDLLIEDGTSRLVVIDDAQAMIDLGLPVDQLVETADGRRLAVLLSLDDNRARAGYDPFVRSVTAHRSGILLRPSPLEDSEVYGLAMPRIKSHLWPAGRGYVVDGHTLETVQVALP